MKISVHLSNDVTISINFMLNDHGHSRTSWWAVNHKGLRFGLGKTLTGAILDAIKYSSPKDKAAFLALSWIEIHDAQKVLVAAHDQVRENEQVRL